jgi:hypothetical protein
VRITTALVAVALIASPALAPTSSSAIGSYQVPACNDAPEAVNNSWSWSTTDLSEPDHFAAHASCPDRVGGSGGLSDQEDGLSTTDALGLSSGAPPGTRAGWTFTAPSGTTIAGLSYGRYIGHAIDPNNSWSPAMRVDGQTLAGETCLDSVEDGETCAVGGPPGQALERAAFAGLDAHELTLGIVCQAPAEEECVTGATQHAVWAAMYGATVTVADATPPTLGTPTGALWSASEAPLSGTQSVSVSGQDVGGGVQSVVLEADGAPVATYDAPCNFTFAQPCPASTAALALSFPTSQLVDGMHSVALVATDAAGNQSSTTERINVQNATPSAPPIISMPTPAPVPISRGQGPPAAPIHVSESLKGRELVVRVSGRAGGRVRVSFTGRLRGRTVASGARIVELKRGRLTAAFRLGPRTAARALIRVSARVDHERTVTSTLRR